MNKITEFQGEYRWLSNFWPVERNITVEHYYQRDKAATIEWRNRIFNARTPGYAKYLSHMCPIREDWEQVKVEVMLKHLRWKFSDEHPELKGKLLATGDSILEEGNTWGDLFWGICPPGSGQGENMLGKLLMQVREEIRKEL